MNTQESLAQRGASWKLASRPAARFNLPANALGMVENNKAKAMKSVTHVPGRKCYLCIGTFRSPGKASLRAPPWVTSPHIDLTFEPSEASPRASASPPHQTKFATLPFRHWRVRLFLLGNGAMRTKI